MFRPDAQDLKQFYATPLGRMTRRLLCDAVQSIWPAMADDCMVGLGYAVPCLPNYLEAEAHYADALVVAGMMREQGGIFWPQDQANRTVLVEEDRLPFADNYVNRILAIHAFEHAQGLRQLTEECWRVLTPGGRMLVVVPNRSGMWSRAPRTPFEQGQPFSQSQLKHVLCEEGPFTFMQSRTALFFPPTKTRFILRAARFFERTGSSLCSGLGGVWLMEVEKQIYASIKQPTAERVKRTAYATGGRPAMTKSR